MIEQDTIDEIVASVRDQGAVSKRAILETHEIDDADYGEVQKRVLKADKAIEKGPQGVGGFAVKLRRNRATDAADATPPFAWKQPWEQKAGERLQKLLDEKTLATLLGRLRETVRQARRQLTKVDRPVAKPELAAALLLTHGIDLFHEPAVRKAIAKAAKVASPGAWHPGKRGARDFVRAAGFPAELAGEPAEEAKDDFEFLEGRFLIGGLEDYQKEVKDELASLMGKAGGRAIVALPTGAGKTRVAVEAIKDWLTPRYDLATKGAKESVVLWLAHTEELCEQACASFRQVWEASYEVCPLRLVRFWGGYTRDLAQHRSELDDCLGRPSVLISTPHRIVNLLDGNVDGGDEVVEGLSGAIGLLLVDEAHRAAAPSYRQILKQLLPAKRKVSVAGLTATPFRTAGDDDVEGAAELKSIFERLIEPIATLGENPRITLQARGVLATPTFQTIKTPTTLRMPKAAKKAAPSEEALEQIDRVLAARADNTARRLAILKELLPLAKDANNLILYFGPTVGDAEAMAYLLRSEGVAASVVSGETRRATRRQVIGDFKAGAIRVLCNRDVLTTGFDAPKVTHVVMARPTVSRVLYEQIVGRGLRGKQFGGTGTCVILDCEDNFRGPRPELGYERFRTVWNAKPTRP